MANYNGMSRYIYKLHENLISSGVREWMDVLTCLQASKNCWQLSSRTGFYVSVNKIFCYVLLKLLLTQYGTKLSEITFCLNIMSCIKMSTILLTTVQ